MKIYDNLALKNEILSTCETGGLPTLAKYMELIRYDKTMLTTFPTIYCSRTTSEDKVKNKVN